MLFAINHDDIVSVCTCLRLFRELRVATRPDMADTTVINWKSFCKPAILPLTTDFMPSANELNSANLYAQYPHTLSLIPDENDFGNEPAHLLQELLSQRLAQDFQIVVWKTVN
jgi:hypothetical protein